jgi:hypothetical protein
MTATISHCMKRIRLLISIKKIGFCL